MRRLWLAGLALVAAAGCSEPQPRPTPKVVLIGDSITRGEGSEPTGRSFAELLQASFGDAVELVNRGCNGSSSLDWTTARGHFSCDEGDTLHVDLYADRARPELPADLVVLMLGTNDAFGGYEPVPLPLEVYRDAMKQLLARLLEDGAQQVLLVIPPPQYHDMRTQKRLFEYRAELEALCAADGDAILCGPDAFLLLQPDDFEPGDPHPNAQGHRKLADALRPAIAAALAAH